MVEANRKLEETISGLPPQVIATGVNSDEAVRLASTLKILKDNDYCHPKRLQLSGWKRLLRRQSRRMSNNHIPGHRSSISVKLAGIILPSEVPN